MADLKLINMRDVRLEQAIVETNAKLVVLEPIQGFLGADVDMHRANEIRPIMKHISELAEKYKCAIILIGHMNKCSVGKSAYRGLGSIDFQAAARSVLIVGRIKDEPEIMCVCQYTEYKTADTDAAREQARQKYLDAIGMHRQARLEFLVVFIG